MYKTVPQEKILIKVQHHDYQPQQQPNNGQALNNVFVKQIKQSDRSQTNQEQSSQCDQSQPESSRKLFVENAKESDPLIDTSIAQQLINCMGTSEQLKSDSHTLLKQSQELFQQKFPNYEKAIINENVPVFEVSFSIFWRFALTLFINTLLAYNVSLINQLFLSEFFVILQYYFTYKMVQRSDFYSQYLCKWRREIKKFLDLNQDLKEFRLNYDEKIIDQIQTLKMELEHSLIDQQMFKIEFFIPPTQKQIEKIKIIRRNLLLTDLFMKKIVTNKNPTQSEIKEGLDKCENMNENNSFNGIEIELLMRLEAVNEKENPYITFVYKSAIYGKVIFGCVFILLYIGSVVKKIFIYYPYLIFSVYLLHNIYKELGKPLTLLPEKIRSLNYCINCLTPNLQIKVDREQKILPTINFFNSNSISTSGYIRKLIHQNGKWLLNQLKFVYTTYILFIIVQVIMGLYNALTGYTIDHNDTEDDLIVDAHLYQMQIFLASMALFQILPIVISVLHFLWLQAETNEYFAKYNDALNQLKLILDQIYLFRQKYFIDNIVPTEPIYQICIHELKKQESFENIEKKINEIRNRLKYESQEINRLENHDQSKIFGFPNTKAKVYVVVSFTCFLAVLLISLFLLLGY